MTDLEAVRQALELLEVDSADKLAALYREQHGLDYGGAGWGFAASVLELHIEQARAVLLTLVGPGMPKVGELA